MRHSSCAACWNSRRTVTQLSLAAFFHIIASQYCICRLVGLMCNIASVSLYFYLLFGALATRSRLKKNCLLKCILQSTPTLCLQSTSITCSFKGTRFVMAFLFGIFMLCINFKPKTGLKVRITYSHIFSYTIIGRLEGRNIFCNVFSLADYILIFRSRLTGGLWSSRCLSRGGAGGHTI